MTDADSRAVLIIGVAVSAWTIGWLIYRRFWTCDVRHRWDVICALKVSDHRGHFVAWWGERQCRRCTKWETITRATKEELAR